MRSTELKSLLTLGFLALTWGSSYILIKKSLVAFSPEQVAALRITISAIAFLPFLLARIKRIDWSKWRFFLVVGLAGSGLPAILFAVAQTHLTSSFTGILSSLTPLFTLLLGISFFGVPFYWNKLVGVMIGLAGAFLLIVVDSQSGPLGTQSSFFYGFLVVLATALYALSSNTVKTYLGHLDSITISAAAFFLIGPMGISLLATTD
ncbi:MAG: DMT family transporter, partial [Phaeodactylibacter sp.]|nr:DMT family transporter [Phaeodactylibacter sp.]